MKLMAPAVLFVGGLCVCFGNLQCNANAHRFMFLPSRDVLDVNDSILCTKDFSFVRLLLCQCSCPTSSTLPGASLTCMMCFRRFFMLFLALQMLGGVFVVCFSQSIYDVTHVHCLQEVSVNLCNLKARIENSLWGTSLWPCVGMSCRRGDRQSPDVASVM